MITRHPSRDDDGGIALSIVVPCFNEASALHRLVDAVTTRFDPDSTELILVDDGSTDGTADVASTLLVGLSHGRLIVLPANRGKGAALRAGVAETRGQKVLFMDADLSTSLDTVDDVLALLDDVDVDVVVGSRGAPGATTTGSPALRVAMGRTFSTLSRLVAGTGILDSQCGFKAFRREAAHLGFALSRIDRFAFDPEVLRILRLTGHRIVEHPVVWTAGERSSVRPLRDSVQTLVDLLALRMRTSPNRVRRAATGLGWSPSDVPPEVPAGGIPTGGIPTGGIPTGGTPAGAPPV
jgi:hypothetical protein